MQVDEDGAFNFLTSICYIKGTAAAEIVPQWCFGAAIVIVFSFVCQFVTEGDIPVPIDAQKVRIRNVSCCLKIVGGRGSLHIFIMHTSNTHVKSNQRKVHGLIGSITGFLLVFRTNLAYDRYYEGRKLVGNMLNSSREVISACYCFLPREDLDREDVEKMQWIKEHIRRKVRGGRGASERRPTTRSEAAS